MVQNVFKVNHKNIRTTSITNLSSDVIVKFEQNVFMKKTSRYRRELF